MLCSVPTGKPGGSNWLDRLRSTKGFPGGDDLDLDRFLSQNPNSSSNSPPLPPNPSAESDGPLAENRSEIPHRIGGRERELAGVVSNVLSELFFMGGSGEKSKLSGKKFPRKQTNPRLCVATSNNVGSGNSNSSVQSDQNKKKRKNNKLKKMKKKKKKKKRSSDFAAKSSPPVNSDSNSLTPANREIDDDVGDEEEEEDEDGEKELKGYSRSEVMVIDTSFAAWKTEKLVFRKKNVWKVREKKGKARSFGRKKRKNGDEEVRDLDCVGSVEKKAKASSGCSQEDNGDQSGNRPSLDERQNLNNDFREEVCRATVDNLNHMTEVGADSSANLGQDFKRRSRFSNSPKKMKRGGSSMVVLTKGIQADKKNSKNCPKVGTQKQHKT